MFEMTRARKTFPRPWTRETSRRSSCGRLPKPPEADGYPGTVKRRMITDSKGECKIKLILSECGGDEFTVKAYIPRARARARNWPRRPSWYGAVCTTR